MQVLLFHREGFGIAGRLADSGTSKVYTDARDGKTLSYEVCPTWSLPCPWSSWGVGVLQGCGRAGTVTFQEHLPRVP